MADAAFLSSLPSPSLVGVTSLKSRSHLCRRQRPRCAPSRRTTSTALSEPPPPPPPDSSSSLQPASPPPPPDDALRRASNDIDISSPTERLGETPDDAPLFNSTIMTAMRDYFGDDGREVEDYMKRPRNSAGRPLFRVLIAGSSAAEIELARTLKESGLMRGLYYVGHKEERVWPSEQGNDPDIDEAQKNGLNVSDMARYADLANDAEPFSVDAVVSFANWAVVDAVFIGADHPDLFGPDAESLLADEDITMYAPDVGRAVASGELDVFKCLAPLAEKEQDDDDSEALLE